MYFEKVVLRNFGPFSDAQFKFEPNQLNWIVGDNGSGKTQLVGAMVAAIVGRPALSITAGGVGPSSVALTIGDGDIRETIELRIKESFNGKAEVARTTGPLMLRALAEMSEPSNQRIMIGHAKETVLAHVNFHAMERFLPESITAHPWWADMLRQSGRRRYIGSSAQVSAAELISQLVSRRLARFKLPLIVDEIIWLWPSEEYDFLLHILTEIANESQVFLISSVFHAIDLDQGLITKISSLRGSVSLSAFNAWFETRKPNLRSQRKSQWIKGALYPRQENRSCEFKEVKGGNPLGAIKGVVDQYVVAFMNAGVAQEGSIFWGIRDTDRAIVGVQLRPQDCDELRRIVTERLHQIVPPIAPTAYRIDLHQVTNNGATVIDDLYVVEVRVPAVRRTLLFATGGQDVYVKTDAGKRKLSVLELQQELIQRLGVDPGL